ncbi:MAG: pyridoxamine 5'-phosphate oxidase-related FMN- binding protein [Chloroflexi bacterium OLB15]|nr:MAG: pyridoxamine 5'-phosphate oxidase-related FMN- binding protein [Chloroflexi bacterium OLB15]
MPENTSQISPTASRPTMQDYGISSDRKGLMDWSWAEEQLGKARNYWICTASADGTPDAAPVWAVWLEGALYFGIGARSRKARNFRHNPNNVIVHLESGDDVVIMRGAVTEMHDAALFVRIAKLYAEKYAFNPGEGDQTPEAAGFWAFKPASGLTWLEKDFPNTATRWAF